MVKRFVYIVLIFLLASCQSEYQKLLQSTDYERMYEVAMAHYENGDYYRAYGLFEKLIPVYRVTEKGETIGFYIAMSYFHERDYLLAAYYFNRFIMSFPQSEYREDAHYKMAICYYYNSPRSSLDQTYTRRAIQAFQIYINRYPRGKHTSESNNYIAELRKKLEVKAFENAKLYYTLHDYRAAIVSLKNCLLDYPDTEFREELLFLIFRSSFLLAERSVEERQQERYENAVDEYRAYIQEFPQGENIREAERMFSRIQNRISI